MSTRDKLSEMSGSSGIRIEGRDYGAPYWIDFDYYNEDDPTGEEAKIMAAAYGLEFIQDGCNGCPMIRGSLATLNDVEALALDYFDNPAGARIVLSTPQGSRQGTVVVFEVVVGGHE